MTFTPLNAALLFAVVCGLTLAASALGVHPFVGLVVMTAIGFGLGFAFRPSGDSQPNAQVLPDSTADDVVQLLLQQMPVPLLLIAQNGRLSYANPAALQILPHAQIGSPIASVIRAPAFYEAIDELLLDRQDRECSFTLTRDQDRYFEARASMLPSGAVQAGHTDQVIVQIEDRTGDKAMLQTRSDFVANASHELRTPLSSILGYVETLQGHAKDDPEAREKFLDIMLKQATRMQRLVDDLMSLSRIEMNAHIRPEEVVDLHRVAIDAASGMFPLATQNDVILQIDISSDTAGPDVLLDRDQLTQVLTNLVDNAIKYGGSGQIVRVAAAEPDPRYPRQAGISVIDKGPGIAREAIPRLTERFYRVNAAQSRDKGGTGLGLAITKHILNRHSGALDVQSKPGEGSIFTIWLPIVASSGDLSVNQNII